jgi:hypothetical protein
MGIGEMGGEADFPDENIAAGHEAGHLVVIEALDIHPLAAPIGSIERVGQGWRGETWSWLPQRGVEDGTSWENARAISVGGAVGEIMTGSPRSIPAAVSPSDWRIGGYENPLDLWPVEMLQALERVWTLLQDCHARLADLVYQLKGGGYVKVGAPAPALDAIIDREIKEKNAARIDLLLQKMARRDAEDAARWEELRRERKAARLQAEVDFQKHLAAIREDDVVVSGPGWAMK